MIPAQFEYERASSIAEAVSLLAQADGEAKLLAGGHSLLPLMKLRMATPSLLVDIGRIDDCSYVQFEDGRLRVGALTRHAALARNELVRRHAPLLAHAAGQVGDPQVRHRGTIGGSLAHGDPASDLPAACLALGATLRIAGPSGERSVAVEDFFAGFLETVLAPEEMLVEIVLPDAEAAGWSFQKFNRRAQDWAIVGVAAVHNGQARVGLVNMAPVPLRAFALEEALASGATLAEAAAKAADGAEPPSDLNASSDFRRRLASVLVRRALEECETRRSGAARHPTV